MAKADLHVHSSFSAHPSEWFLQRLGARESYIEPEDVYRKAKNEGMDFVTLTDHNCIDGVLQLKDAHPLDVFVSVESTAYFPENGCKIHILIFGLNKGQFDQIERLRQSIYLLRDYLRAENLVCSVAHATFAVNQLLTFDHIERLMLLFDCFEGINGSRNRVNNEILCKALASLSPDTIDRLHEKYHIEPWGESSWLKGLTGGSDDHSGLFIGRTSTAAHADTIEEFLSAIANKETYPMGRHNDYRGLAFAIYKVAYDFSRSRSKEWSFSIFTAINSMIFDTEPMGFKDRVALEKIKFAKSSKPDPLKQFLLDIIETFKNQNRMPIEQKLDLIYDKIAASSDALVKALFERMGSHVGTMDLIGIFQSATSALPGVFLSLPFFTSLSVLSSSRPLLDKMNAAYIDPHVRRPKRVLWFTDTLTDLNGVAETLIEIARRASERNFELILAGCVIDSDNQAVLPANLLRLPCVHTYTPTWFSTYTLRIPSVLTSLKQAYLSEPDEIYISTPGPVGMIGLLCAKLLHVPCTAVYHTDFGAQARQILDDETMARFVDDFNMWFHRQADRVAVPTQEYQRLLAEKGIPSAKLCRFRRGIDPQIFAPVKEAKTQVSELFGIREGINLLYSGRISKEKNLDFLADVYKSLKLHHPDINLVLAGNGPYLDEYSKKMAEFPRIHLIGRIERKKLPLLYSAADLFVFPSTTDTFGMVILEAQCCGCPAIVSDTGGPKEIIIDGATGRVASADSLEKWVSAISEIIAMMSTDSQRYQNMRQASRENVVAVHSWDRVMTDIFGAADNYPSATAAKISDVSQNAGIQAEPALL